METRDFADLVSLAAFCDEHRLTLRASRPPGEAAWLAWAEDAWGRRLVVLTPTVGYWEAFGVGSTADAALRAFSAEVAGHEAAGLNGAWRRVRVPAEVAAHRGGFESLTALALRVAWQFVASVDPGRCCEIDGRGTDRDQALAIIESAAATEPDGGAP